jgi:hypothetical protein
VIGIGHAEEQAECAAPVAAVVAGSAEQHTVVPIGAVAAAAFPCDTGYLEWRSNVFAQIGDRERGNAGGEVDSVGLITLTGAAAAAAATGVRSAMDQCWID